MDMRVHREVIIQKKYSFIILYNCNPLFHNITQPLWLNHDYGWLKMERYGLSSNLTILNIKLRLLHLTSLQKRLPNNVKDNKDFIVLFFFGGKQSLQITLSAQIMLQTSFVDHPVHVCPFPPALIIMIHCLRILCLRHY